MRLRTAAVLLAFILVPAACGSSAAGSGASTTTPPPSLIRDPALRSPLTVFAAASLTEAFRDIATANPGVDITFDFAGSQALVTQLIQGAGADVVATADQRSMQRLVDAGLVEAP